MYMRCNVSAGEIRAQQAPQSAVVRLSVFDSGRSSVQGGTCSLVGGGGVVSGGWNGRESGGLLLLRH